MNLLIIDTCNAPMTVIGVSGDKTAHRSSDGVQKLYNKLLLTFVDDVLADLKIGIRDIDAIACVVGAGSFTGIRIGVAAAHGLARGIGARLIELTEFEVMAWGTRGKFLALIDAGHDSYYAGEFHDKMPLRYCNLTKQEAAEYDGTVCVRSANIDINQFVNAALNKYRQSVFVGQLTPMYLKESQAERERREREKSLNTEGAKE